MSARYGDLLGHSLAALLIAGAAHAGDPQAASDFFRAGKAAYARGDYRAAATAFEAAHHEAPHAATRYNAAIAWELAREGARAADGYDAALAQPEGLSEEQLRDALDRLARLESSLGRVEASGPRGAKISVAHIDSVHLPARFHLAPGEHRLSVVFPDGREDARIVRVAARATRAIAFAGPTPWISGAPPAATADGGATPPAEGAAQPPPPSDAADDGTSPLVIAGWIGIGTGVVFGVVTGVLGVATLEANDDFDADRTNADARDEAVTLRTWTNVTLVGALVCAGAGVTLLLLAPSTPDGGGVSVRVGPGSLLAGATF